MPPVIIPVALTAAAAFATAGTTTALVITGLALASALISYTLTPSLPQRKGSTSSRLVNIRSGTEPRKLLYGRTRIGGLIAFATTSESRNQHLHIGLALGEGPIDAIETVYFNDLPAGHESFTGFVHLTSYLGTINQTADPTLIAVSNKWRALRGRGVAWLYVRLIWDPKGNAWPAGVPTISSVVRGRRLWDPRLSPIPIRFSINHIVRTQAVHNLSLGDQLWITETEVWGWHEVVSTPSSTTLVIDDHYGQTVEPEHGMIYELLWSNNAALCILDYLLYLRRGMPWEMITTILDLESFRIAADICDESVHFINQMPQSRYTINGEISLESQPIDILEEMLKACAGRLVVIGGRISLHVGSPSTPTHTLTEADIIEPVMVLPRPSRKNLFNTLHGTFRDETDLWRENDLPSTTDPVWIEQDGNESLSRDVSFDFVTDKARAQCLHRILLNETRQATKVTLVGGLGLMSIGVWDVIRLSLSDLGYREKLFRVEAWRLEADGRIRLTLQEYADASYTWNPRGQTIDDAPDTYLPRLGEIKEPQNLSILSGDSSLLLQTDGVIVSRIKVSWEPPEDAFISYYELQWRHIGEESWESRLLGREELGTYISDVQDNLWYQVRLRAIGFSGVLSQWVQSASHQVIGKTAPPPAPETFRVSVQPDGTRMFEWTLSEVPVDVRVGGGWLVRYSIQDGREWDQMRPLHQGIWVSSPVEINRPGAGMWRFAIRTVDSSGNLSPVVFSGDQQLPYQRLKDLIFYRREADEGWPGSFSNAYLEENGTTVWSVGRWSNLEARWSNLADHWGKVDQASTWSYTTPVIDFGADIELVLLWNSLPSGLTVDMRLGTHRDQGVTGSWLPIVTERIQGRYVMVRISGGDDRDYMELFEVLGDAELLNQQWNDLDISSEDQLWFKRIGSGIFQIAGTRLALLLQAQITAIHGTEGRWTWSLVSKHVTLNNYPAAEFRVYNASGVPSDAVVDIQLRGPQVVLSGQGT